MLGAEMDHAAVRASIRQLVFEMAPQRREGLANPNLVDDLGFDSLGLLELAAAIENEFGTPPIAETDVTGVATVTQVEGLVVRLLSEAGARK
jgi:acyl carrier protein